MKRLAITVFLLVLAGCGAQPSSAPPTTDAGLRSTQEAVADWYADHGPVIEEGSGLLSEVASAASNYDTDGLYDACSDLEDWADEASSLPPVPNPAVEEHWSNAVDHARASARACQDGIAQADPDLLSESADEIGAMADELSAATEALDTSS